MKFKRISTIIAMAALTTSVFVGCGAKAETADAGLKDGTYTAQGDQDEKGYTASIEITVAEGKISAVKYDEKDASGVSKLDMPEYNEKMEAKGGAKPTTAYPALEASLVEKQDVATVDSVTGASTTSTSFTTLAEKALETAK